MANIDRSSMVSVSLRSDISVSVAPPTEEKAQRNFSLGGIARSFTAFFVSAGNVASSTLSQAREARSSLCANFPLLPSLTSYFNSASSLRSSLAKGFTFETPSFLKSSVSSRGSNEETAQGVGSSEKGPSEQKAQDVESSGVNLISSEDAIKTERHNKAIESLAARLAEHTMEDVPLFSFHENMLKPTEGEKSLLNKLTMRQKTQLNSLIKESNGNDLRIADFLKDRIPN